MLHHAGELADGRGDVHGEQVALRLGLDEGAGTFLLQVFLRRAVVIVVGESRFAVGVNLVGAEVGRYLRGIVIGLRHRNDAAALHEHGQFPERRGVIVEYAAALVRVAAEIVNPLAFG